MHLKVKKKFLNILIFIGIVLSLISFFTPMTIFNYKDVLEKNGFESNIYQIHSDSAFLRYTLAEDITDPDNPKIRESLKIFHFIKFHIRKDDFESGISKINDYDIEDDTRPFISFSIMELVEMIFSFLILINL